MISKNNVHTLILDELVLGGWYADDLLEIGIAALLAYGRAFAT